MPPIIRKHKAQTSINQKTQKKNTHTHTKAHEKANPHNYHQYVLTRTHLHTDTQVKWKKGRRNQSESVGPADRRTTNLTLCIRCNRTLNAQQQYEY